MNMFFRYIPTIVNNKKNFIYEAMTPAVKQKVDLDITKKTIEKKPNKYLNPTKPTQTPELPPIDIYIPEIKYKPEVMKTSLKGMIEIMSHEALVLSRYKDNVGVWTIGFGITSGAGSRINPKTFTGTITIRQAIEMFVKALPRYEKIVRKSLQGVEVEQHEFDALVSMVYNVGYLGKSGSRLAREGRVAEAINLYRKNKSNQGLMKRRDAEVALAATGIYHAKSINMYFATKSGRVIWSRPNIISKERIKDILMSL